MNRVTRSPWVWSVAFLLAAAVAVVAAATRGDGPAPMTAAPPARSAQPPPGFSTEAVRGIKSPTAMAVAPDGRLFVTQQTGEIRIVKDGALLADPFVEIAVVADREQGLVGITLDPEFESRPFVYVHYTSPTPVRHNRVSRFTAAGDRAVAGSEITLLDLPPLDSTQHVGGAIHFGPDGMLFVGVGDNDGSERAQTLDNPFGKILRIRFDGTVPDDNPFFDGDGPNWDGIWAIGFRNPYSFSWSRATGRLFVADVGEEAWEEIDDVRRGGNYGWPVREGPCARGSTTNCAAVPGLAEPLHAYAHPDGCAVTGAAFYEPPPSAGRRFPSDYIGDFFFADLCNGALRRLDGPDHWTAVDFIPAETGMSIVDIASAPDGSLWYLSIGLNAAVRVTWSD